MEQTWQQAQWGQPVRSTPNARNGTNGHRLNVTTQPLSVDDSFWDDFHGGWEHYQEKSGQARRPNQLARCPWDDVCSKERANVHSRMNNGRNHLPSSQGTGNVGMSVRGSSSFSVGGQIDSFPSPSVWMNPQTRWGNVHLGNMEESTFADTWRSEHFSPLQSASDSSWRSVAETSTHMSPPRQKTASDDVHVKVLNTGTRARKQLDNNQQTKRSDAQWWRASDPDTSKAIPQPTVSASHDAPTATSTHGTGVGLSFWKDAIAEGGTSLSPETKFTRGKLPIHFAARSGDIAALEEMLGHGIPVDVVDDSGVSVLHYACRSGSVETVDFLVDRGADIYACTSIGTTCLMVAATSNNPDLVYFLVGCGATLDDVNESGKTALHLAAGQSCTQSMQALINCGADASATNEDGDTVLTCAAIRGDTNMLQLFLDALVENGCQTYGDRAILFVDTVEALCSAEHVDMEKLTVLLKHRFFAEDGDGLMHVLLDDMWKGAVLDGNMNLAMAFLQAKEQNLDQPQGVMPATTMLRFAMECDDVEVGRCLLDDGAQLNAPPYPLLEAISQGNTDFVELLLQYGADFNVRTERGENCMHAAVHGDLSDESTDFGMIDALIHNGVPVDLVGEDKQTALHKAVIAGKVSAIGALLDYEANIEARDSRGMTPLFHACSQGKFVVASVLLSYGADITARASNGSFPLFEAVTKRNKEMLRYLLSEMAPVDQAICDGSTALMSAVVRSNSDIVDVLLEYGACTDQTLREGKTLLGYAAGHADIKIMLALLEADAEINQTDADGSTALHDASRKGHVDVVQLLLEHGADAFMKDAESRTALRLATVSGHPETCRVLKEDMILKRRQSLTMADNVRRNSEGMSQRSLEEVTIENIIETMERALLCPITLEVMDDPVVATDGHSYERSAITQWLRTTGKSPMTQQEMSDESLVPNWCLKHQIALYHDLRSKQNTEQL